MAARSPEPAKRCDRPQSLSASAAGRRRASISASTSMAAERRAAGVIVRPLADLPRGWFLLEGDIARRFEAELASELPPVHYLKGVPVQAVAKDDASDDAIFRHTNEPDHWSVVHLTWISKPEQPP